VAATEPHATIVTSSHRAPKEYFRPSDRRSLSAHDPLFVRVNRRNTFVCGVTVALLLFAYATMEALVVDLLVDKIGMSNSLANALLGTVLALAFHPIKNRMEHTLKRMGPRATQPEPVTR
jgi:hypothetical protein